MKLNLTRLPVLLLSFLLTGIITALPTSDAAAQANIHLMAVRQWDKTVGGINQDYLTALQQTSSGGYILGGYSSSIPNAFKTQGSKGGVDYWVILLDATGNKIWDKTFGTSSDDRLVDIQQTTDGGYILAGYTSGGINGDKTQAAIGTLDFWVVKITSAGVKQWDKTYGGTFNDILVSVQQTSDGGYIFGGYSESGITGDKTEAGRGSNDYWMIKTNSSGVKQWDKAFGGSGSDELTSVKQTKDGGYMLTGSSPSGISGDKTEASRGQNDYWMVKTNALGVKTWDKTLGGNLNDLCLDAIQTLDGGYLLAGSSNSANKNDKSQTSRGGVDYWIIKTNTLGQKKWDKRFGGTLADVCTSVIQLADSSYILGGTSKSGKNGDKAEANLGLDDFWLMKVNKDGTNHWNKAFGGTSNDYLARLRRTSDGGYIAGGYSTSNIGSDKSQPNLGDVDYWILKTTGGAPMGLEDDLTNGFGVAQNQPNPFSGNTTIAFKLPKPETTEFTLYNQTGQLISTYTNHFPAGINSLNWTDLPETKNLPEGIYFYRISAGRLSETKKLVLLKQ